MGVWQTGLPTRVTARGISTSCSRSATWPCSPCRKPTCSRNASKNERLEEELSIARTIQRKLLPDPIPSIPGLQIAATNVSSYQVGGDYFDVLTRDSGTYIAIAGRHRQRNTRIPADGQSSGDVARAHANVGITQRCYLPHQRYHLQEYPPAINSSVSSGAGIATKPGHSPYTNAGHNPPLLLRSGSGEADLLAEGGVLLWSHALHDTVQVCRCYPSKG